MAHDFLSVEDICRKLRPIFGKKIDSLYLRYKMSEDRDARAEIESTLSVLYEKHLNTHLLTEKVLLEPPELEVINGAYPLGTVSYADKDLYAFALREEDWPRHVCITGMSGSGKTNFAYQIIGNFILRNKPFIIMDWKKSFRPLLSVKDSMLIFTVGNNKVCNEFRFNINIPPPGISPKEWVNTLCDLINESFFASYGVHKILVETLDELFNTFGVFKGSEHYPTWYQVRDRLEEKEIELKGRHGRESEWLASAIRIAHALTYGEFGEAVNQRGSFGLTVEDLLSKQVIFELNSLSAAEKKFFCEYVLTYIYKFKKGSPHPKGRAFTSAIVVDEAHNIFLKEKTQFVKESITDMVYREIREYGISLICLDQHISKLSDTVSGNSATSIAFQQVLPQDVEIISSIMQLRDQRKFFSMLAVGQGIVRLAERYNLPFLISTPNIDLKNEVVEDHEITSRMAPLVLQWQATKKEERKQTHEEVKLKQIFHDSGVSIDIQPKRYFSDMESYTPKILERRGEMFSEDQRLIAFLKVVNSMPGHATTQIYKALHLSGRKGHRIKSLALDRGLIREEELRNEQGWKKMLSITTDGARAVKEANVNPSVASGEFD